MQKNIEKLPTSTVPPHRRLHSGYHHGVLRKWHSLNTSIGPDNLMFPVFVNDDLSGSHEIKSMPGVQSHALDCVVQSLKHVVEKGLSSILIFGAIKSELKDANATVIDTPKNPTISAIQKIKKEYPNLLIACDVCLCGYTDHGHCGILNEDGSIDNERSINRIAEVALSYAEAGCDVVAPSDMMDGRIFAIKQKLIEKKLEGKVSVLSYSVKYASCFYGPFRDAAHSAPAFGDRRCYQLPPGSHGLSLRAAKRDVEEGADMLIVKPGLSYLDMVKELKQNFPEYPLFVYQVSGEYAMLMHASKAGVFELRAVVLETLTSMRRAGADVIISYFTPLVLDWIAEI
ncbi:Delta-aminolevulinic acid dehydratase [Nymphon striatum]|nr:Delta-aminolevulinic acid dehydratase [Nymphon striatum]